MVLYYFMLKITFTHNLEFSVDLMYFVSGLNRFFNYFLSLTISLYIRMINDLLMNIITA